MPRQTISPLVASMAATAAAALLSGLVVLGFERLLLDPAEVAAQPLSPAASAVATAAFAVMTGGVSTGFAIAFARWFRPGLALYALAALAVAFWLSGLALTTKPSEAPMYLALHAVFVLTFGIAIPLLWSAA